jgi:hypothetical protein
LSIILCIEIQIGCTSVFTISLYIYIYNVFHNMFRSYMTIIRLFYMDINPSFPTIPPYTGKCLHLEVRCYCPYNKCNWNIKTYKLKLLQLLQLSKIFFVFRNSCVVLSSTFTSTPVSLLMWNVYQMDCWYFDIWITKQLFQIGSYVSSCCMGCGHALFCGFLVCFPSYACCVDLLCVLACVEVVVLVSGVEVRVRPKHVV